MRKKPLHIDKIYHKTVLIEKHRANQPITVKIIRSTRDSYWYADFIGRNYEVRENGKEYFSMIPNNDTRAILKKDCVIAK